MLALIRGQPRRLMDSINLSIYLRREIERRGLTERRFAEIADIPAPTLNNIINHPEKTPRLETLYLISRALGVSLAKVVELCGFPVGAVDDVAPMLLRSVGDSEDVQSILHELLQLPAEDRAAIRAYLAGLRSRR